MQMVDRFHWGRGASIFVGFWCLLCLAHGGTSKRAPRVLLSQPKRPSRVQYYSTKDFLNCEGANFSTSWRDFRLNAVDNFDKGLPRDDGLFQQSMRIYNEFIQDSTARSMMQVEVLLKLKPVSALRDFCLYGFATALLILFRHTFDSQYLLTIQSLMGWSEWPLDFSESSSWPTLWRIAPLHLEKLDLHGDTSWSANFKHWGREVDMLPHPTVDEVESAILQWLGAEKISPQFFDGLSKSRVRAPILERKVIKVLVAGHHMGSSMEPFTMLSRAIESKLDLEIEAQFHGQRHPAPGVVCKEFGYCNDNSKLDQWFRRYESRWIGEYDWMENSWPDSLEQLASAVKSDSFLSSTDFMVCGGPAWFCSMYRGVHPVPMFLYFAWPLVPMIPENLRAHYLWQIQALGQTVSPPTVFVVANWLLAAQFALQVRLNVPVVRVHGLYVNQTYNPVPAPNGFPRVVFSRLGQWTKNAGPALLELAWGFMKEEQRGDKNAFPFELVFLSIRVRGITPIFHATYEEMAQFHACVFWPWDYMMMFFSELYTVTMPLLTPDRHWMHDIMLHSLRQTEVNWWHMRAENVGGNLPSASAKEFPLPHLPWSAAGDGGLSEAAYWYSLTEFEQFPHVTHFASLPDMLEKLRSLDVDSIRLGMRRFNQRTMSSSMAFYHEAAALLLS